MGTEPQIATLAGGCFWCMEAVFKELRGVLLVESGYSGGTVVNPTYRQVCDGGTGHAEVVQVSFDQQVISYADLLNIFFAVHDPTTPNRQGEDIGSQYRSVIFFHNPEQEQFARQIITALNQQHLWADPIVTQVVPYKTFYKAEDYHQDYFANNPDQAYCKVVVAPKVTQFRKHFFEKLKK